MSSPIHLVWFKRDLRVADHAPLHHAARAGPVVPLYIIEPGYWALPDTSLRHWDFLRHSLAELDTTLRALGQPLVVRQGDATAVLGEILATLPIAAVHSHQETGNNWTYQRDRAVAALLRQRGVPWQEYRQHGIKRPLPRRDGWSRQWETLMGEPCLPVPNSLQPAPRIKRETLPDRPPPLSGEERIRVQTPGRRAAEAVLQGFLTDRGRRYAGGISSPVSAWTASSRLSPHLAYGTLSLREVVQASRARRRDLKGTLPPGNARKYWLRSLQQFEKRLHWHCHFMQKLEDEPRIEFGNMQRSADGLREDAFNTPHFEAWRVGRTGFPLVDACMRAVNATGWLNFRMRAMLVSFAAYHLWLHWREPALHLARMYTDYEPGIHYCQMQMQSGTTGINALRIYNPVKQSREHDPKGQFIRRWVPELAEVPDDWLHQPWDMPDRLQARSGCRIGQDYPMRIVDHERAARQAREQFRTLRRDAQARQEAEGIRQRHASRRRGRSRTGPSPQKRDDRQLSLFPDRAGKHGS
ncbi:deoxyribodipyrimidine photo-lyase family protein (cryptochrome) [Alkalispirillum mobile]|uniref:Deoxyribodipyrimidine photo-lyase family protein (Cryptochrome) n=1 Tax=Alkalispirillum mobile TaxID=85925 RepID=A0A498C920_9GAMM|nr:deoxyribodipyrimidine photo-lyase [Alkalispirillum mobile]RLK48821.1 deoxyribodipyrimidine photo-lyase family protein (cryptochrome) [Alkalispirillum mobile]